MLQCFPERGGVGASLPTRIAICQSTGLLAVCKPCCSPLTFPTPNFRRTKKSYDPYGTSGVTRGVACSSLLSPDALFTCTTIAAIPIYTALIALPHSRQITALLNSRVLLFAASLIYTAGYFSCYFSGALSPSVHAFSNLFANWKVERFASLLQCKQLTSLAWTHLVLLDMFQARFVYIDGQRHGIPVRHSLLLCFMFGPLGLLFHMMTKALIRRRGPSEQPVS